jgi:transposase InsO family protein
LSPVIDLFNNEVISYSLSERPVMNMVENMLDQAFKKLKLTSILFCTLTRMAVSYEKEISLKNKVLHRACPEKAIVWIMQSWNVSLEP